MDPCSFFLLLLIAFYVLGGATGQNRDRERDR